MMECGKDLRSGSRTTTDTCGETSKVSIEQAKILTYKLVRVEKDGSFVPASEDELTEVEHLLAEPTNEEKGLMESVMGFEALRTDESLAIEGVLYTSTAQEGNVEPEQELIHGMLRRVDEGDLHVAHGFSGACDDYLLDNEFSEKVLHYDYGPSGGSHPGNLGQDSHSPTLRDGGRGATKISKLSTPTISLPESSSDRNSLLLDKMTIRELQETFRSMFGRDTTVKDKQWLQRRITFGLQNLVEVDTAPLLLDNGISSNVCEGKRLLTSSDDSGGIIYHSFTNPVGNKTKLIGQGLERNRFSGRDATTTRYSGNVRYGSVRMEDAEGVQKQKRQRKPTQRYIEESSNRKSRSCGGRLDVPFTDSRDKLIRARSHSLNHRKGFEATTVVYKQDSFKGSISGIQVPFGLQVQKGRPKKNTSILYLEDNNNDLGSSADESHDDMSDDSFTKTRSVKSGSRRKHHKIWNLSEVVKLVDGVAQFGVGRWTEIKRLFFSTSAHRTSVDLKDKWRNLLRASGAQLPNKRQVEQGRKHLTRPIPSSVLRRISELAIVHPYPRQRKSKLTCKAPAVTHRAPAIFTDPNISRRGRIIHRKNIT